MTFAECLEVAKTLEYNEPLKEASAYTYEDLCYAALSQVLKNDIILCCAVLSCQKIPLLKPIFKSTLKEYIRRYGGESMVPGKKQK